MDFNDVLDSLDSLWFFSNVLSSSTIHLPSSTPPVSVAESAQPMSRNVHERVWSWLQDAAEASAEAVEDAAEPELSQTLEDAEQSTLLAMVMSEPSKFLPPPNPRPNCCDCGRKKPKSRKKLKSVKNVLYEKRRSVLAELEYDYVRQLERCHISVAGEYFGPLSRKHVVKT